MRPSDRHSKLIPAIKDIKCTLASQDRGNKTRQSTTGAVFPRSFPHLPAPLGPRASCGKWAPHAETDYSIRRGVPQGRDIGYRAQLAGTNRGGFGADSVGSSHTASASTSKADGAGASGWRWRGWGECRLPCWGSGPRGVRERRWSCRPAAATAGGIEPACRSWYGRARRDVACALFQRDLQHQSTGEQVTPWCGTKYRGPVLWPRRVAARRGRC